VTVRPSITLAVTVIAAAAWCFQHLRSSSRRSLLVQDARRRGEALTMTTWPPSEDEDGEAGWSGLVWAGQLSSVRAAAGGRRLGCDDRTHAATYRQTHGPRTALVV